MTDVEKLENYDKLWKALCDAEDIQFRFKCGVNMISAIHVAITEGDATGEAWEGALYSAYDYLDGLCKELETALNARG